MIEKLQVNETADDTTSSTEYEATSDHTMLHLQGIQRYFPGVHALKDVNLSVQAGEVHALVGENGAGKSTLMAVASGALEANEGKIFIGGTELQDASPQDARDLGLSIVRQDPALLPDLTVAENMLIGVGYDRIGGIKNSKAWSLEQLAHWEMNIDPASRVDEISIEQRFVVEIAKALATNPKVLILDEPTEHLGKPLVEKLFSMVRERVRAGSAVVYISHRIPEVKSISDRLTVLRDGQIRGTFQAQEVTEEEIVELVIGRKLETVFPEKGSLSGAVHEYDKIIIDKLNAAGFHDISFSVKAGEILGLAGVQGNGQADLIRALAGVSASSGKVTVKDTVVKRSSNSQAAKSGIVYVPADRHTEGLYLPLSVGSNIASRAMNEVSTANVVSDTKVANLAREQISRLNIRTPSHRTPVQNLSGGNQQKVVLAKSLLANPQVILAEEPSQGVDAGARVEIYRILREAADDGAAVIMLSSDGVELEGLCDRVLIMSRGHIVTELTGSNVTEQGIARAALTATVERVKDQKATKSEGKDRKFSQWLRGDQSPAAVLALILLGLAAVVGLMNDSYYSSFNISNLLLLVAPMIFVGSAQLIVVLGAGFDLSLGPLMGFLVVLGSFWIIDGGNIWLGLVLIAAGAFLVGALNGFLISRFTLSPIVVTLATFMALQGLFLALRPTPGGLFSANLTSFVSLKVGPIPIAFIVAIAAALFLEFALRRTRWGIELRAFGSRADAAKRLGINIRRTQLMSYAAASLLVLPAVIIMMSQIGIGDGRPSVAYTLSSVAVVVLAGASIFGGRGSFIGIILAATLLQQVINAIPFIGLSQEWAYILPGLITLVAAVFYAQLRRTRN